MSAYFKFEGELRLALRAEMQGEEVRHISQSRRLRPGDDFLLQDRLGQRFRVKLLNQIRQRLEFEVLEAVVVPEPSPLLLELWLALPKEKALELILQKGVELGVSRVVLFQGEFSSGRAETPTINTQQRWERIMSEACKQSGRQFSPTWTWFQSLEAALGQTTATDQHWIFAPLLGFFGVADSPEKKWWGKNTPFGLALREDGTLLSLHWHIRQKPDHLR
jgi:16S rRNA (uracil1498-N3)-methyltransferase